MNADTLARLTREAEAPEGIAVRVSGPEMKRLLEERAELLEALRETARVIDIGGGPTGLCRAVELGQLSWMSKLNSALGMADFALSQADES